MEEQAESITGETTVVRARQTMRHWSVTSLTSEFQKVPYLSKKRRNFLGLKKKKNEQKVQYHSGVTAGKLQMQLSDAYFGCTARFFKTKQALGSKLLVWRQHCFKDEKQRMKYPSS
ncbi:putative uncharacterized protein C3orf49 homolog [Caretta caretta]|uniref:putative uncharacterized protein C3orf49 homolog n=1 Tax=Caretta caretta TaxID=8467 RepID=UPI003F4B2D1D